MQHTGGRSIGHDVDSKTYRPFWSMSPSKGKRCNLPSGKPRRNLLQQPTIAIGITEGGERPVSTMFRIWTTNRTIRTQVEDLTHLNPGGDDRISGCFDV